MVYFPRTLLIGAAIGALTPALNSCANPNQRPEPVAQSPRVSLADATALVRAHLFTAKPTMNPAAEFPLKETTPAEVSERMRTQVFTVTAGIAQFQSFVIHSGQVSPLGRSFGGFGITSMVVTDLDGDGRPELAFAYSWGSGIHRSQVGIWTAGTEWQDAPIAVRDHDLVLVKSDDRCVHAYYGSFYGSVSLDFSNQV